MPANKANARGLCEVPCSQCNLLTRADADRCLHCNANLRLSFRARAPRSQQRKRSAKGFSDYASAMDNQ
jgi:hypothetical protein